MRTENAFAGIAVCAVAADGVVTEEEVRSLEAALLRLESYRAIGEHELRAIVDGHFESLRDDGVDALLRRCAKALPDALKPSAYAVAVDLVLTDHKVEAREERLLGLLRSALAVAADEAKIIERVLRIKNQM